MPPGAAAVDDERGSGSRTWRCVSTDASAPGAYRLKVTLSDGPYDLDKMRESAPQSLALLDAPAVVTLEGTDVLFLRARIDAEWVEHHGVFNAGGRGRDVVLVCRARAIDPLGVTRVLRSAVASARAGAK
jgi:hypothetical protein